MSDLDVSHGRGGAGNIGPESVKYTDGEVVRAGPEGSHDDGPYSTGRGGAGNVGDAGRKSVERTDRDLVPEAAVRASVDTDYHTGRGGAGNARIVPEAEKQKEAPVVSTVATAPISVADKLKGKIFGVFKK